MTIYPDSRRAADTRPWYRKKRYAIPVGILGVLLLLTIVAVASAPPEGELASDVQTEQSATAEIVTVVTEVVTEPPDPDVVVERTSSSRNETSSSGNSMSERRDFRRCAVGFVDATTPSTCCGSASGRLRTRSPRRPWPILSQRRTATRAITLRANHQRCRL